MYVYFGNLKAHGSPDPLKKVCLSDFLSDKFKKLNVDNQMSQSCGQDEPLGCPKNAFFSCVIGIYFVSFFFDHLVC